MANPNASQMSTCFPTYVQCGMEEQLCRAQPENQYEFTTKAADIVGLYLNPPQNALIVSVDEKNQAFRRLNVQSGTSRLETVKSSEA